MDCRAVVWYGLVMGEGDDLQSDFPRIGKPALRGLRAAGYANLSQLTEVRETELARLHGMGSKAIGLLRAALAAKHETFRPE